MFSIKWLKRAGRLVLFAYGIALIASDAYPRIRGGAHVSIGLEEVLGGLFCIGFGFGLKAWSSLAWAIRGTLIVLTYCAYEGFVYGWRVLDWVLYAAFMVAGLLGQYAARRQALGFIYDAQNERQKVEHWNRGNAVYKPTTHAERIVLEATLKAKRRKTLAWSVLFGGTPALCAWYMLGSSYSTLALVPGLIGAPFLLAAAWELLVELAYQWGYQDMPGAKVLDAEPVRPGLVDIDGQKVHGDAPFATEDEALRFLQPQG